MLKQVLRRLVSAPVDEACERTLLAKMLIRQLVQGAEPTDLSECEFRVFSQFGDDGIIQYLIRRVPIANRFFVEFGVEDYSESNTRFLLTNDNWSGLVMDGSDRNMRRLRHAPYFWRHDLQAVATFVTAENINGLLSSCPSDIGLLHIDIDGMDYWVWKALDVSRLRPAIVILEYNSVFGPERAITVPYSASFDRTTAHHSNLYEGASLRALDLLSQEKGYVLVGSNSAGNNAYFVRRELATSVRSRSVEEAYVESKFRESRDEQGNLSFLRGPERLAAIRGLPVYNVLEGRLEAL